MDNVLFCPNCEEKLIEIDEIICNYIPYEDFILFHKTSKIMYCDNCGFLKEPKHLKKLHAFINDYMEFISYNLSPPNGAKNIIM